MPLKPKPISNVVLLYIHKNDCKTVRVKRILTYILLLLVLTLSVHPVLSMHFCQDDLQSFNIQSLSNNNMCCMPAEAEKTNNVDAPSLSLITTDNSCCSTTNLEVVTDNFTQNSSQSIQLPTESTYMAGWFAVNYLINLIATDTTTETTFNFPINGSYLKTLHFLSLICVYRL